MVMKCIAEASKLMIDVREKQLQEIIRAVDILQEHISNDQFPPSHPHITTSE